MSERTNNYAAFAYKSYSWHHIERPALDRAIPQDVYNGTLPILDIGCGPGRIVDYHINRGASEDSIIGIDPNTRSIELARERFPNTHFTLGKAQDIEALHLADSSLGFVTAVLSLRYLNNNELSTLCDRVSTALTIGGLFVMLDVHPIRYGIKDGFEAYYKEGPREVSTPWGGSEDYHYRGLGTYMRAGLAANLTLLDLDECPISKEGRTEAHADDYAHYSESPYRFALSFQKLD